MKLYIYSDILSLQLNKWGISKEIVDYFSVMVVHVLLEGGKRYYYKISIGMILSSFFK